MDFTYFKNGEIYYNCTILGFYAWNVIAIVTVPNITSDLAIQFLYKVLELQLAIKN